MLKMCEKMKAFNKKNDYFIGGEIQKQVKG